MEAQQARTEADRESLNAHSAELGDRKVAKLMNQHHDADNDDKFQNDEEDVHDLISRR